MAAPAAIICGLLCLALPDRNAQAQNNGDPAISPFFVSEVFQGLQDPNGIGFLGTNVVFNTSNLSTIGSPTILTNAIVQENGSTATSNAFTFANGFFTARNSVDMTLANSSPLSGYYTIAGSGSRTKVQFFTPEAAAQSSVFHWRVTGTESAPIGQATGRLDFLAGQYGNRDFYYLFQNGNGALKVFGPGQYTYNLNTPLNVPIDLFYWSSAFAQVNRGQAQQGGNYTLFANYANTSELTQIELFDANNTLIPQWTMTDLEANRVVFNQNGPVPPCTPPPPDMIAWYPAEGNANDVQGPTFENGILQNGATFAPGIVGQAFSFDGVNDQVTIPHAANQNTGSQITIDAWVYPTALSHGQTIFQKRSSSNVGGYVFETAAQPFAADRSLQWVIMIGGVYQSLGTGSVLALNTWQHVAATYDGATMRIYVNGVEVANRPQTGAIDPVTDTIVIGRNVVNGAAWQGLIDEVELFSRALTDSEIAAIYNAGSGGKCRTCTPPPSDMVAWYAGDGNANDIQGPTYENGTLEGNATFTLGMVGQAFRLDGAGDRVLIADSPVFHLQDFTIDAWIRRASPTVVTNDGRPGVEGGVFFAYGNGGYAFLIDQATSRLALSRVEVSAVFSTGTITDTNYHHVAVTKSGSSVAFYIDGAPAGTANYDPGFTFTTNLAIGARGDNDLQNAFFGDVDEMEIFNRPLSQTEIQAIYAAGDAGKCKPINTFTVNTTDDIDNGACTVTHCSLREAINAANNNGGSDTIRFNIPGTGVHTIQLSTPLPPLTDPVTIDGFTQPGSSPNTLVWGNNAHPQVEVNGSSLGGASGFVVQGSAGGSTIRGLVINGFNAQFLNAGVLLDNSDGNVIEGCFIGTSAAGDSSVSNNNGIFLVNAHNNQIGGTAPAQRNLVSGNEHYGIDLFAGSDNNSIQGNYVGTSVGGDFSVGNADGGIFINSCSNNLIGGTNAPPPAKPGTAPIRANTDTSPASSRPLYVHAGNLLINVGPKNSSGQPTTGGAGTGPLRPSGTTPNFFNVISGNGNAGVRLAGSPPSMDNQILGNYIGIDGDTDPNSSYGIANQGAGIYIGDAASNTSIGLVTGGGNFISFNDGAGIQVAGTDSTRPTGQPVLSVHNEIVYNSINSNGGLGIELGTDGVTLNDSCDADTGPNNLQNFPVLTSAQTDGVNTIVTGTLNSMPNKSYRIELFQTVTRDKGGAIINSCDPSGYGQGLNTYGFVFVDTDSSCEGSFKFQSFALEPGTTITATATDLSTQPGDTSEFSECLTVVSSVCPAITLTPATLPAGVVGTAYNQSVGANGGASPYTFGVSDGSLPPGLMLNANTGQISGTPTTVNGGPFGFTITATDANNCTGSQFYSVTINCPTITVSPASLPDGQVGTPYSQSISASGTPGPFTFIVTGGALPNGMTLSTSGQLGGTPTVSGLFNFTVTATDVAAGCSGNRAYSLQVNCATVTVNPASLPNPQLGTPYSQAITASGSPGPFNFGVTAGALPNGLTLSTSGQLSGTPTTTGSFNFTVTATDSIAGCSGGRAYTVQINCATITVNPSSLPNGQVGTAYSQAITANGSPGPFGFGVTAGALPNGLTLSTSGQLSGTPTTSGSFNFTITATDNVTGCSGGRAYSIQVNCATVTVNPSSLPNGQVGTAYSQAITASGSPGPFSFGITTGGLPNGLTLSTSGLLSGSPTISGSFNFTVTATDSVAGCSGSRSYSVQINCATVTVNPSSLPNGQVGTAYSQTITASGSPGPFSFGVTDGSLPKGLVLSPTGQLSGTPSQSGQFNFTVTANDTAAGCSGSRVYALSIADMCEVCHKRGGNAGGITLTLPCGSSEYARHLDHGDTPGPCPQSGVK